jgi:PKD repeat protein
MADYQKKINTEVTFTPSDPALTSYAWHVDGVPESTAQVFKKTFTSLGVHTVSLEGLNACGGNCVPVSTTIEVVETVTPPQQAAAAAPSIAPIILGVLALAALGIIVTAGKK